MLSSNGPIEKFLTVRVLTWMPRACPCVFGLMRCDTCHSLGVSFATASALPPGSVRVEKIFSGKMIPLGA
eukprot:11210965-Lingulodinium_polyedra.AAC.1